MSDRGAREMEEEFGAMYSSPREEMRAKRLAEEYSGRSRKRKNLRKKKNKFGSNGFRWPEGF